MVANIIYIINTVENKKIIGANTYIGFDTCSQSQIFVTDTILKRLLSNTGMQIVNASLQEDDIIIKDWGNGITFRTSEIKNGAPVTEYTGPKFILISKENDVYTLIGCNGVLYKIERHKLESLVKSEEVANCCLLDKIIVKDFYEIKQDAEFEKLIKSKYESFLAKTIMLGYGKITFEYAIENHEVRLSKYTGQSKDIILPTFVNYIEQRAFEGKYIQTIKLNEGLRIIGSKALSDNRLERIEIPESVELIGSGAFAYNNKLWDSFNLNMDRVKLRSCRTLMLNQNG